MRHATILTFTAAVLTSLVHHGPARAGDTWDGGGATDHWTIGANWNPGVGFQFPPPNNGTANLSFPCFGGIVHQPLMDVPYSINSMTFGSGSGRYVLLGAAELTIGGGGIVNNDADVQSIIGPVKLSAHQTWTAAAGPLQMDAINLNGFNLNCTGDFPISLPSVIVGGGGINVAGGIEVTLAGSTNNSYTGITSANNGTLVLQKSSGAVAVPGPLTINESEPGTPATVRLAGVEQISHAPGNTVHVFPGGLLDANTRTEKLDTLWLDGGDAFTSGTGKLTARAAYVIGPTAAWINSGSTLTVGDDAEGSLAVSLGGDVTSQNAYVGRLTTGNGTVSLSGAGSTWIGTGFIAIGEAGTGTLNVSGGATVSSAHATIGQTSSSNGSVNITGANSTWVNSTFLEIGKSGFGMLTIADGGSVSNNNSYIGLSPLGDGLVNVSGANAMWECSGNLQVGPSGTGALAIENGGVVEVGQNTLIGLLGEVTMITGGTLDSGGTITVDGGLLTASNGAWLTSVGAVRLQDGAEMQVLSNADCTAPWWFVGDGPGGLASLHVDGSGSVLEATNCCIDVGYNAAGIVTITGGGRIESVSGGIGSWDTLQAGTHGTLIIDGTDAAGIPSSWVSTSGPHIALSPGSVGDVQIVNGGLFMTGQIAIGQAGSATVLLSGADSSGDPSTFQAGSVQLAPGAVSQAAVDVEAGARMNTANLTLSGTGGTSSLTVDGTGSSVIQAGSSTLNVGHASAGSAEITVLNGARFITGTGATTVYATGEINVQSGGVFDARGPLNLNGGAFNFFGGTLHVGTFNGNLVNVAGTLAPGYSPGTTTISGNYTQQSAATLEIEIGGVFPGEWDAVYVQGNAIADGTLQVVLIDGFQPVVGNSFTILTTNVGNVGGAFDTLSLPPGMDVTYQPQAIVVTMNVVPCPADINGDDIVNVADLLGVIAAWGPCSDPNNCPADVNGDDNVNVADLLAVIGAWGACP